MREAIAAVNQFFDCDVHWWHEMLMSASIERAQVLSSVRSNKTNSGVAR